MRRITILAILLVMGTGCGHSRDEIKKPSPTTKSVMTPINRVSGHVVLVNADLKYVVVDFPTGKLPVPNQRLNVYHEGDKVAEIIISPQSRDSTFAADIVKGEVQPRDIVRED